MLSEPAPRARRMRIIMNHQPAAWVIISDGMNTRTMKMPRKAHADCAAFAQAAAPDGLPVNRLNLARCLFFSLGVGLLVACAGPAPAPGTPAATPPSAEQLFASGEYEQAARSWQQQAMSAPAQAAALRVRAADAWLLAGQPGRAQEILRWIDHTELTAPEQAQMKLVLADLALRAEQPAEADVLLQQAEAALAPSDRARYARLRARADQMLSAPGTRDLSRVLALSRSVTRYEPGQALELLQALGNIPSGELALRAWNPRTDQALTGWLDLALVMRQNLAAPETLPRAVNSWKSRYPQHPLSENEALDLWLRYRQQFSMPDKVAVLLPESGRFQAAAEAMRDGILNAFLDHPGGSELIFLDTGSEGELATPAYFEAREQGAQWIIGPLQKPSVEALLRLPGLVTPLLALNDLPQEFIAPPGLAGRVQSISFSPEEEVRSLAREMIRSGFRRALILAPDSEWGERMARNFRDEFVREDRQIVDAGRYPESENDHSQELERLLKIDESKARAKGLQNTLQMKLEFEPIRRDDFDVIFLAADATQGRLLRPQLRFHYAGDVPVYATGKVFNGRPDRQADQDLNGVRIPITPWQLEHASERDIPDMASLRGGTFASLYALGADAWNILPWLDMMQRDPDFRFAGASGYYHSGAGGKILREPAFAVFSGGRPVPLSPSPGVMARH